MHREKNQRYPFIKNWRKPKIFTFTKLKAVRELSTDYISLWLIPPVLMLPWAQFDMSIFTFLGGFFSILIPNYNPCMCTYVRNEPFKEDE